MGASLIEPAYAARGIRPFMPSAELCRTALEPCRRPRLFSSRRANFVPVPFGIVWPTIGRPGRRAAGPLVESGWVSCARTASLLRDCGGEHELCRAAYRQVADKYWDKPLRSA